MKSNAYVLIDAHIIKCRLHHQNNHKYSVALKSGKQNEVSTQYKQSKDLIIEMDTHLSLQADKYTYDNFPKLTLIVNIMGQANEKKSVGTTFANFKKQGLQIFQVSECSCKDKAFEVEIFFTLKMIEAKSSKESTSKNLINQDKKMNYFSYQPTPRESRQLKLQRFSKPLKDNIKTESKQKTQKMNRFNSQKVIVNAKNEAMQLQNKQKIVQSLKKQIEYLNKKNKIQQQRLQELKGLSSELQKIKQNNDLLRQLLVLQEQKSEESSKYILYLQHSILGLTVKETSLASAGCITSFKTIEEKDQIIEINQQLQGQLQIERQRNNLLQLQIYQLKRQLMQAQQKNQERNRISQISIHSVRNSVALQTEYQIPILSIHNQNKEGPEIYKQKEMLNQLRQQIKSFQQKISVLKIQISKLQIGKKQMQKDNPKLKTPSFNKKKSPSKPQILKKQEARKNEKGTSSDKNWKPPKQSTKKIIQSPMSNIQILAKKSIDANSTNSADMIEKPTKIASTQVETKTERQQSMDDFQSNQQKSEQKSKVCNQIVYFTDGFDT